MKWRGQQWPIYDDLLIMSSQNSRNRDLAKTREKLVASQITMAIFLSLDRHFKKGNKS